LRFTRRLDVGQRLEGHTPAGLSPSRFKARFRTEMGLSPREYVLRENIRPAKHLLAETPQTTLSVALQCGLSNSQYFALSAFRAHDPSQYRRSLSP